VPIITTMMMIMLTAVMMFAAVMAVPAVSALLLGHLLEVLLACTSLLRQRAWRLMMRHVYLTLRPLKGSPL
jgi:hypothetical protein